jgi:hypothetical protein
MSGRGPSSRGPLLPLSRTCHGHHSHPPHSPFPFPMPRGEWRGVTNDLLPTCVPCPGDILLTRCGPDAEVRGPRYCGRHWTVWTWGHLLVSWRLCGPSHYLKAPAASRARGPPGLRSPPDPDYPEPETEPESQSQRRCYMRGDRKILCAYKGYSISQTLVEGVASSAPALPRSAPWVWLL